MAARRFIAIVVSRSELELIEPVFRCVIDLHPVFVEVGQTGHVFANTSHSPSKLSIMVGDPANEPHVRADFKSIHRVSLPNEGWYANRQLRCTQDAF